MPVRLPEPEMLDMLSLAVPAKLGVSTCRGQRIFEEKIGLYGGAYRLRLRLAEH
jgi:hypothetical protein